MSCEVVRVIVIGAGNVGRRLGAALDAAGVPTVLVTRTTGWDTALDPGLRAPRIVAVREESLGDVLARMPATLHDRLVLVQNGFLEVVHGPLPHVTRGLVWFNAKEASFRELAPTLFHGPLAAGLAAALARGGLDVREIADPRAFVHAMIVKGAWNAVVGLPLAVHGVDLATYLATFGPECRAILAEACAAATAEYGVAVRPDEAEDVLRRTTASIGDARGGTKALAWRNGAIVEMGRRHGVPTPVNAALIERSAEAAGRGGRPTA